MAQKMSQSEQRLFWIWGAMLQRCRNPKNKHFQNYGGRGIAVCDRWSSFKCFKEDMGAPQDGFTLERIDNDKGYSPDNCKWADRVTQSNNRRYCIFVEVDGERITLKQAWRRISPQELSYRAVHKRVDKGEDPISALTRPPRTWAGRQQVNWKAKDQYMQLAA